MVKVRTDDVLSVLVYYPPNRSLGNWIAQEDVSVTPTTLEDIETRLIGQEKASFINFLRTMLQWLPEERKTAKELLQDPWLHI